MREFLIKVRASDRRTRSLCRALSSTKLERFTCDYELLVGLPNESSNVSGIVRSVILFPGKVSQKHSFQQRLAVLFQTDLNPIMHGHRLYLHMHIICSITLGNSLFGIGTIPPDVYTLSLSLSFILLSFSLFLYLVILFFSLSLSLSLFPSLYLSLYFSFHIHKPYYLSAKNKPCPERFDMRQA